MKRIVLLSDGTGNSSAKLFKTNVWRLYQALDMTQETDETVQVACYNDGVGTSSFKPLAILGGAFGWGLKRNVLHLYEYLCKTYEKGDEIYVFGFSRGAFTVRILVGLILNQGLITNCTDRDLSNLAVDAYRQYRQKFNEKSWLFKAMRGLRARVVGLYRRSGQAEPTHVPEIAFVGVWDTVAAYGTPFAELTRGIDHWVWPLSMPDYCLSPHVKHARHALALDDERDTFHPVLWDEVAEREMIRKGSVQPDRMQQVWFAGMHADVGGGYPDDSLSCMPLLWMMQEARQVGHLRFRPEAVDQLRLLFSRSGPLHDSRRGLSGYYRYQPRRIAARMERPELVSLIMRDPHRDAMGRLTKVQVHASVFQRIAAGPERYAPIVLPANYTIVPPDCCPAPALETPAQARARVAGQEELWNDVWRRRIGYYAMVLVSLGLASAPLWNAQAACQGWLCLLVPLLRFVGGFLPGFAQAWINGFATNPGWFVLLAGALALLLARSARLEQRIRDRMRPLWKPLHGAPVPPPPPSRGDAWIRRVRESVPYQKTLQYLKWKALPAIFGISTLAISAIFILLLLTVPVARVMIAASERHADSCTQDPAAADKVRVFDTRNYCWDTGSPPIRAGTTYEVVMTVQQPWLDASIVANPAGFDSSRKSFRSGYLAVPLLRAINGRWFQPFLTIKDGDRYQGTQKLDFHDTGMTFVATFKATMTGQAYLWVNDAALPWDGWWDHYYKNNHGTALVDIHPLLPPPAS